MFTPSNGPRAGLSQVGHPGRRYLQVMGPSGMPSLAGRRLLAAMVAVAAAMALVASPAGAQTTIGDVEERLNVLEAQIRHGEDEAASYQAQLVELAGQITIERGNLAEIRANLEATDQRVWASELQLGEFKAQMRARAREIYKRGGALSMIGVVLGAESMNDFVGRVSYANELAKQDSALMQDALTLNEKLRKLQEYQRLLLRKQAAAVANLETKQDNVDDVFARQQGVLADLAMARGEALDLVERLAANIGPGASAAIKRVAGHGMTISYADWAKSFLRALGAPVVRSNMIVVIAWEAAEGTQATWNPLATTMGAEGATDFNSVGVKNFLSKEQGIDASIRTLMRPSFGYEAILDGLERGADQMETAHAIQQSHWCHGCAEGGYVIGIVPAVEKYYDDYATEGAKEQAPPVQELAPDPSKDAIDADPAA
jgi:peptidoglycan hydrolase CwlO-like protein